jgi:hypothetical protein
MTSRKTQQEIDKTFKKVAEGIAVFESIYEKIKSTSNPTQRDKLEENLKKEIKKLQRFRDQIKSWAAGNEVKDKAPLLEQRRAIETVHTPTLLSNPLIFLMRLLTLSIFHTVHGAIQSGRERNEDEGIFKRRPIGCLSFRS